MTAPVRESKHGEFISEAPRLGFVGGFDGMRGIGVSIVLFGHLFPDETDSLNPIVDVFFVISAFLIVSLLMQERRQNGSIDLKRFYTRRAIRLLPNSYACMLAWLLIWVAVKATGISLDGDAMEQVNLIPGNVLAAATYTYHLVYPIGGDIGPLVQFWSLALEEQFYLIVGVFVVWALAARRRMWGAVGFMVLAIVYIGWSRWNSDFGPWPGGEYKLDIWTRGLRLMWFSRPDALLVGVLLAIINAKLPDPLSPRVRTFIVWSGTIGALLGAVIMMSSLELLHGRGFPFFVPGIPRDPSQIINRNGEMWCALEVGAEHRPCTEELWIMRWIFSAMGLAVAPFTLCMARVKDAPISKFMSLKWFRKVGEMSYSLYVWHILAFVFITMVFGGLPKAPLFVLEILGAFGISWLAHRYIDRAVLGIKLRFSSEQMVLDRRTGKEVDVSTLSRKKKDSKSD